MHFDHPPLHGPRETPMPGCAQCDKETMRPITRCHGLGKSEEVIPRGPDRT